MSLCSSKSQGCRDMPHPLLRSEWHAWLPATAEASRYYGSPCPTHITQRDQVSRMVGSWNAVKSLCASGCMYAVRVEIPSLSSDRIWIECAFQRPSAPRL